VQWAGVVSTSEMVSVSGRLSDSSGAPLGISSPVDIELVVRLYPDLMGGAAIHTESFLAANNQIVRVQNGFFVVHLGEGYSSQNVMDVMANHPNLYAEFQVGIGSGAEVLSPRIPVTTSAYGGAPNFTSGSGSPTTMAKVGAIYQNTVDNSLWYRVPGTWVRMSN
jgi:hypothetical protein